MNAELLNIKQKIISNKQYQNWMNQISNVETVFTNSSNFNNKVALDHGIKHMERVANNVYKLLKEYSLGSYRDYVLGYIAGLIHDIGMINGKKGHAKLGSIMSIDFLKDLNLVDENELELIKNAIENHSNGTNSKSIITSILAICDKIDICEERALGKLSPIRFINDYTVKIQKNILQIEYKMSNLKGKEAFYIIPKSIDIPTVLGKDLNLDVKFFINNKIETFEDRKNYKGEIYNRYDTYS